MIQKKRIVDNSHRFFILKEFYFISERMSSIQQCEFHSRNSNINQFVTKGLIRSMTLLRRDNEYYHTWQTDRVTFS
jgi:hypothetical protein